MYWRRKFHLFDRDVDVTQCQGPCWARSGLCLQEAWLSVQLGCAASHISHPCAGVLHPLEGRWSFTLRVWGLHFSSWQLGKVVRVKISRVSSKMVNLTGFGLNCWHRSEVMSDWSCSAGWSLIAKQMKCWPVRELCKPFPGSAAARLPVEGLWWQRCAGVLQLPKLQSFSKRLSIFRWAGGSW